eukprot:5280792-Pyramimonas_sp.AAC.1
MTGIIRWTATCPPIGTWSPAPISPTPTPAPTPTSTPNRTWAMPTPTSTPTPTRWWFAAASAPLDRTQVPRASDPTAV